MTNLESLKATFREIFSLSADEDVLKLAYSKHKRWDSIGHMQLVNALERTFDVMLDTEDVIAMSSFSAAKEILEKHGVKFDA